MSVRVVPDTPFQPKRHTVLLQVENVECLEPSSIKFDFLGKDSVPYENTVEVKPPVFRNVRRWIKKDAAGSSEPPGITSCHASQCCSAVS